AGTANALRAMGNPRPERGPLYSRQAGRFRGRPASGSPPLSGAVARPAAQRRPALSGTAARERAAGRQPRVPAVSGRPAARGIGALVGAPSRLAGDRAALPDLG